MGCKKTPGSDCEATTTAAQGTVCGDDKVGYIQRNFSFFLTFQYYKYRYKICFRSIAYRENVFQRKSR